MNRLTVVERQLSIAELFRLVEIAHEAGPSEVRTHALAVLERALHSVMVVCDTTPQEEIPF